MVLRYTSYLCEASAGEQAGCGEHDESGGEAHNTLRQDPYGRTRAADSRCISNEASRVQLPRPIGVPEEARLAQRSMRHNGRSDRPGSCCEGSPSYSTGPPPSESGASR